jgi:hypothetical protein
VTDAKGRALYPLCEPSYNDVGTAARFNKQSLQEHDELVLTTRPTIAALADAFDIDREEFQATVDDWNAACTAGLDRAYGRPQPA